MKKNKLYIETVEEMIEEDQEKNKECVEDLFFQIMNKYVDVELDKNLLMINGNIFYEENNIEEEQDIKQFIRKIVIETYYTIKEKYQSSLYKIGEENENHIMYIMRTKTKTIIVTFNYKRKFVDDNVLNTVDSISYQIYNLEYEREELYYE